MKKYIYAVIILSGLGALISSVFWIWSYYPDMALGPVSCGNEIFNPCVGASASKWYMPAGLPLPLFNIFMYIYIIFIMLTADYSGGRYPLISIALAIPVTGLILGLNIVLTALTWSFDRIFIWMWMVPFLMHAAVFAISIKFYLILSKKSERSLIGIIKNIFEDPGDNPDRKACIAYSTLFVFLLAAVLLSTNYIFRLRNPELKLSEKQISAFMDSFYSSPAENLNLPETSLVSGNPDAQMTVSVFTDFLCPACIKFFDTEKYLLSRFPGRIKFAVYHYPLDRFCNSDTDSTLHINSCTASAAMEAAAKSGILAKYMNIHFREQKGAEGVYSVEKALSVLDKTGISENRIRSFREYLHSEEASEKIQKSVDAAAELKIDSTPTVFINGRRLEGALPAELLALLIQKELGNGEKASE